MKWSLIYSVLSFVFLILFLKKATQIYFYAQNELYYFLLYLPFLMPPYSIPP